MRVHVNPSLPAYVQIAVSDFEIVLSIHPSFYKVFVLFFFFRFFFFASSCYFFIFFSFFFYTQQRSSIMFCRSINSMPICCSSLLSGCIHTLYTYCSTNIQPIHRSHCFARLRTFGLSWPRVTPLSRESHNCAAD